MKTAFLLKNNWIEIFDRLSDKQAGMLIKMLFDYNVNGDVPAGMNDEVVNAYFNMMRLDSDTMKENYDRRCETSAQNGKSGGRPRKGENLNKPNPKPKKPNNLSKPDNDCEYDYDYDSDCDGNPPLPPVGRARECADVFDERFELLWQAYPRKEAKPAAKKAFRKLKPSQELTERMIRAVELWKRSDQWQRDNGQYIPYPATWLNNERWNDEPGKFHGNHQRGASPAANENSDDENERLRRKSRFTDEERIEYERRYGEPVPET